MKADSDWKTALLFYGVAAGMPLFVVGFSLLLSSYPQYALFIVPLFAGCSLLAPFMFLRIYKGVGPLPPQAKKWMALHFAEYVTWGAVITVNSLKYPVGDGVNVALIGLCVALFIWRKRVSKAWTMQAKQG